STLFRSFGFFDFMRVPAPAANTMAAASMMLLRSVAFLPIGLRPGRPVGSVRLAGFLEPAGHTGDILAFAAQRVAQTLLVPRLAQNLLNAGERRFVLMLFELTLHFFQQLVLALLAQHAHHLFAQSLTNIADRAAFQKAAFAQINHDLEHAAAL